MTGKQFAWASLGVLLCGAAWMGLPMTVLSQNHPVFTIILKVLGTGIGAYSIYFIAKKYF
jgi:hypothetical protein